MAAKSKGRKLTAWPCMAQPLGGRLPMDVNIAQRASVKGTQAAAAQAGTRARVPRARTLAFHFLRSEDDTAGRLAEGTSRRAAGPNGVRLRRAGEQGLQVGRQRQAAAADGPDGLDSARSSTSVTVPPASLLPSSDHDQILDRSRQRKNAASWVGRRRRQHTAAHLGWGRGHGPQYARRAR